MREFYLIVIGSGSGLDVADAVAESGKEVAIVEKGPLGGTCLNRGCIPSKMLIHSADIMESIQSAEQFSIKVKGHEVDFASIVKRVNANIDGDSARIEQALKHSRNPVLFKEQCRFVDQKTLRVGNDAIKAEKILIAAGSRAKVPDIKGLKESGFITSDEALRLKTQPRVLTILGGGYIAAELAHFFGSLGTEINIVQRGKLLVPNEDEDISEMFTHLMSHDYNVLTGYTPVNVSRHEGIFEVTIEGVENKEQKIIKSDQLLVATGRAPNSDILDLEKTGVNVDEKGNVVVNRFLETSVTGIFALGDVIGRYPFKHVANYEAQYVYINIMNPDAMEAVDYTAMPHAIFSSPQIAGVGKTEQQLRAEKVKYLVGVWNYYDTAMGQAIEDQSGFVKFLVDSNTMKILGCHMLGTEASTLIHEVLVAMRSGDGSIGNISKVVHIHP
ncbi:MAG: dihydrolipoyl dehydrogenase, partial [Candidatus Methanomethyliaceae archaeon]|nr:dihydrolipoyl dehydrogenase [Candidatus Methanomethyliaceae archaeon]